MIELAGPFLTPGAMTWTRRGSRRMGPPTLSQKPQIARLDGGGFWEAVLEDIALLEQGDMNYWQSLETQIGDGVDWLIVPRVTFDSVPEGNLSAEVGADAALRATTVEIVMTGGASLIGGETCSIEHADLSHRLYQIGGATDLGSDAWSCRIAPPLRKAVTAGVAVEFTLPKCTMTLVGDISFTRLPNWKGGPAVRFEEAF